MNVRRIGIACLVVVACAVFSLGLLAQDTTKTQTATGAAAKQVQVERGEVVYISGNEIVVKMDTGEVRHVTVPDGARATVDGREIGLSDLKVGMKLQRSITTTTTPQTVTTIRTIQGKVWAVNPPNTVILTLPDATNKKYNIPKGQKFSIGGETKTAFELKKGMNVSATVLVTVPSTVVAQQRKVMGSAPAPVVVPAQVEPTMLVEVAEPVKPTPVAEPAPAAAPAEPAPAALPKTGSLTPLAGLLGLISCGLSFGLGLIRRTR